MEETGMRLRQLAGWLGIVIVLCYILHCDIVPLSPDHREVVTRKLTDMYWHNPDTGHTSSGQPGEGRPVNGHISSSWLILFIPPRSWASLAIWFASGKIWCWDIKYSGSFQQKERLYHIFSHNKMPPGYPRISNHTRQRAEGDQTLILTLIHTDQELRWLLINCPHIGSLYTSDFRTLKCIPGLWPGTWVQL